MKTVSELGLDHKRCEYSTGICETLTAGQGKLSEMGYFDIPCPECAEAMEDHIHQRLACIGALASGQ